MGREIELKIPLSSLEYESAYKNNILSSAYNEITFYNQTKSLITKTDEYYSKYKSREERIKSNEPSAIRLRTETVQGEGSKSFFTIKQRNCKNGVEYNEENETQIENTDVLRTFFKLAGYKIWFRKEKSAYSSYCKFVGIEFHIELVKVNNLPYIEIEVTEEIAENQKSSEEMSKSLEKLVKILGFDITKKDARSWVEIIEAQKL